jgi:hypothetical protein
MEGRWIVVRPRLSSDVREMEVRGRVFDAAGDGPDRRFQFLVVFQLFQYFVLTEGEPGVPICMVI